MTNRHDGWTAQKQIAFIEALVETACVEQACGRVGMSASSAYKLRRPARFGEWVDRMLAPDPEEWCEQSAGILDCELDEIAERAPDEDGNVEDEWGWDSRAR